MPNSGLHVDCFLIFMSDSSDIHNRSYQKSLSKSLLLNSLVELNDGIRRAINDNSNENTQALPGYTKPCRMGFFGVQSCIQIFCIPSDLKKLAGGKHLAQLSGGRKENYKTSRQCLRCILGNKLTWVRETMQGLHGSLWREIKKN